MTTITIPQIWILLIEAIGILFVDKKILPFYILITLATIIMFFFF